MKTMLCVRALEIKYTGFLLLRNQEVWASSEIECGGPVKDYWQWRCAQQLAAQGKGLPAPSNPREVIRPMLASYNW